MTSVPAIAGVAFGTINLKNQIKKVKKKKKEISKLKHNRGHTCNSKNFGTLEFNWAQVLQLQQFGSELKIQTNNQRGREELWG